MMLHNLEETAALKGSELTFGAVASAFVFTSLRVMLPWLIAAAVITACGFVLRVRAAYRTQEKTDFWQMVGAAMGDMVTYFSFIVMFCMLDPVLDGDYNVGRRACLGVCVVGICRGFSYFLLPLGYEIDWTALFVNLLKCLFAKGDFSGVIRRTDRSGDSGDSGDGGDSPDKKDQ